MDIEAAKLTLENEVNDFPHTYGDPFGNAGSCRKLIDFLYVSIMSNEVSREDAKDWLFKLYDKQSQEEKWLFNRRVDVVMAAFERLKNQGKLE